MIFTLEDGTGLEDSNAYIDVEFFNNYHALLGHCNYAIHPDEEKQAAIVRATLYIEKRFGSRFKGYRKKASQSLCWPRYDAYNESGYTLKEIPKELKYATAEYALRALNLGELAPDPKRLNKAQDWSQQDQSNSGETNSGLIASEKVEVGKGAVVKEVEYVKSSDMKDISKSKASSVISDVNIPEYPEADMMIEALLKSSLYGVTERS